MHEFLVSTAAFVVLVGVMVIVHEFGHFAVAKLCGVRVEAFSFGFGPRLFGVKYGETDYKVCLLPLGGYVKMTGETPDQVSGAASETDNEKLAADAGSFTTHPRWQRILIGLAGPTANFVLALVLMVIYYGWINEVPLVQVKSTTVDWVVPESNAAAAGFQTGDIITHFDNVDHPDWEHVREQSILNAGQLISATVERGGNSLNLTLHVPASAKSDDFDLGDAGLEPQYLPGPIVVAEVAPGTPAEQAGLRQGDAIDAVDGHAFHSVDALVAYMKAGQGKPIDLTVLRNNATVQLVAHPAKLDATGYKLGFVWVPPPFHQDPLPLGKAFTKATNFCSDNSLLIVEVLQRIFTRRIAVSQLAGPVGIARMAGDAAEMKGWLPKFGLAGEISLNLGILNLMPFPILDGGLILLLLIESVIRRDISIDVKERIYQAAFVVLVAFFAFIIFNDVTKLPIFSHMKP
ncbi:MAG: RIP metalloprotease RseP [Terracidiphilus sp.]